MAKLPSNFVKAASFDNPLRPTTTATPDVEAKPEPAPDVPVANDDQPAAKALENGPPADEPLAHRFTLRLNERQWRALHTECLMRRMQGEPIKVADILRDIVNAWVERQPQP